MKKSLNKVLILSLAALVLAGTGCERRGRAAKKAAPTDAITAVGNGGNPVVKPVGDSVEVSSKDIQTLCPISIDETETPTAESMATDVVAMNKLRDCLGGDEKTGHKGYGVKAIQATDPATKTTTWYIEAGTLNAQGDEVKIVDGKEEVMNPHSPLLAAFDAEATAEGSNDDQAARIMESRIELLELNAKKMLDKYTESLSAEGEFSIPGQGIFKVGSTLDSFSKVISACEDARKIVAGYWTVRDGVERKTSDSITHLTDAKPAPLPQI